MEMEKKYCAQRRAPIIPEAGGIVLMLSTNNQVSSKRKTDHQHKQKVKL